MHKVVRFTCWWLPLASSLSPTCNTEPLHLVPNPPPKCRIIASLPIFLANAPHSKLVAGVIISVSNHLIWYRSIIHDLKALYKIYKLNQTLLSTCTVTYSVTASCISVGLHWFSLSPSWDCFGFRFLGELGTAGLFFDENFSLAMILQQ